MPETLLPIDDLATDQELATKYASVTVTPAAAPDWAYRLILPKDWVQDDGFAQTLPEPGVLAQLGLFGSPAGAIKAGVQIWATIVPFEVSLADWLTQMAEERDMELLAGAVREVERGQVVEVLAQRLQGDRTMLIRLTAYADGSRVFLVNGLADPEHYPELSKTLGLVAVSFAPVTPSADTHLEKLKLFEDQAGKMAFYYPSSWGVEPLALNAARAGVALKLSEGGELFGFLRVHSMTLYATPEQTLASLRHECVAGDVELGALEMVENDGDWGEMLWVGTATLKGRPCDCAIALKPFLLPEEAVALQSNPVRQEVASGVAALLLSPPREREVWAWMRSKRALEIVVASAQPGTGFVA